MIKKSPMLVLLLFIFISGHSQNNIGAIRFVKSLEVLSDAIPWLEDRKAFVDTKDDIDKNGARLMKLFEWNNNSGYLVRVRVEQNVVSQAYVPMKPQYLGIGNKPVTALVDSYAEPSMTSAPSNSPLMRMAEDKFFYIWITTEKGLFGKRHLVYGKIDGDFYQQLNMEALQTIANQDLKSSLLQERKTRIFEQMIDRLQREVTDAQARTRIAEQREAYLALTKTINSLQQRLNNDLSEIQRADEALKTINTLRNVLTVATLAVQVKAMLNEAPAKEIDKAKNAGELYKVVETHKTTVNGKVVEYERTLSIQKDQEQAIQKAFTDELRSHGAPAELINESLF